MRVVTGFQNILRRLPEAKTTSPTYFGSGPVTRSVAVSSEVNEDRD